jgi:hypothetical protein
MPVSSAEYKKLLDREKNRYPNDRDRAVRSANVAAGYGSSTAERKGGGGGDKPKPKAKSSGGAPKVDAGATGIKPKNAGKGSPFGLPPSGKAPTPTPKPTQLPADLAPSPNPLQPNSPVGPGNAAAPFGNPAPSFTPPMNPAMSQASVLQTVPPDLQAQPPQSTMPGRPPAPGGGFPAAAPPSTMPGRPVAPAGPMPGRDAMASQMAFPGRPPAPAGNGASGLMTPLSALPGTAGANTIQGPSLLELLQSLGQGAAGSDLMQPIGGLPGMAGRDMFR